MLDFASTRHRTFDAVHSQGTVEAVPSLCVHLNDTFQSLVVARRVVQELEPTWRLQDLHDTIATNVVSVRMQVAQVGLVGVLPTNRKVYHRRVDVLAVALAITQECIAMTCHYAVSPAAVVAVRRPAMMVRVSTVFMPSNRPSISVCQL